jgi:predicted nucleic acid-binding protein
VILLDTNVVSEPMRSNPDRSVLTWLDAQSVESLYLATVSPDNFLVLILFFVRDLIQSPWRTLRPMP